MFELQNFHEYACLNFNLYFTSCDKYKKDDNVFKLPFKKQINYLAHNLYETISCSDFFIALYWITFILSIIGFLETCNELIRVFNDESYVPMTFGKRTYDYVKVKDRRNARICGLTLNLKLFIGVVYGLMRGRTSYILPWIVVYGIVIPLEAIYWSFEIYKRRTLRSMPTRWLILLTVRWSLTLYIMSVINKNKFN